MLQAAPNASTDSFREAARAEAVGAELTPTYRFPEIDAGGTRLRSAAAGGVDAVFIDGRPDWSRTDTKQLIHRDFLVANPLNPRRYVSRDQMMSLLESVMEGGIHQPIKVSEEAETGKAILLSGHRRLWVIDVLNLDLVPCELDPRGPLSEVQMREALIGYNEGQEKPAPIDRALSVLEYVQHSPLSQKEAAARLNMAYISMYKLLRLLTLPDEVKDLVNRGKLKESVAYELTCLPEGSDLVKTLAFRAVSENLTTDKVKRLVQASRSASGIRAQLGKTHTPTVSRTKSQIIVVGSVEHPVEVHVSSNKAECSPSQVQAAINGALMSLPVEMGVHHDDGTASKEQIMLRPDRAALSPTAEPQRSAPAAPAASSADQQYDYPRVTTPRGELRSAAAQSIKASFIGGTPDWSRTGTTQLIYTDALVPHPWNPRKLVSREKLEETMESVRAVGVHSPLRITQHPDDPTKAYVLGGHRRLFISRQLQLGLVPCNLDPRGVLSEAQVREELIRDNEGQVKPAPVDRAIAYRDYLAASKLSVEKAAGRLGVSDETIRRSLQLLALPKPILELINQGQIGESVAHAILEHRGGRSAQLGIAHRAIRQQLTAAQVKDISKNAHFSVAHLSGEDDGASGTERHWTIGDSLRIHVHLSCPTRALERHEIADCLAEALKKAQLLGLDKKEKRALEKETQSTSAPPEKAQRIEIADGRIPLSHLSPMAPAVAKRIFERYLPSLLVAAHDDVTLSPTVAGALQKARTNVELERFDLRLSKLTVENALRWHREERPETGSPKISLAKIITYWGALAEELKGPLGGRKVLSAMDIEGYPVDVDTYKNVKPQPVYQAVLAKLKGMHQVLSERILPTYEAEVLERRMRTQVGNGSAVTLDHLKSLGISIPVSFRANYAQWCANKNLSQPADGTVDVQQFRTYLMGSVRSLLDLTGGKLERFVGRAQLTARLIPFDGSFATADQRFIGVRALFRDLSGLLEALNEV